MKKQFFVIVYWIFLQSCIDAEETCLNPNRQVGRCIPLRNCTHLYQLFLAKPLTGENRRVLLRSQCAFRNSQPYVCCVPSGLAGSDFTQPEKTCSNINHQVGTCMPLRNCTHLYQNLSNTPLTNDVRTFLARSKCAPFVCCAPDTPPPASPSATNANNGTTGLTEIDFPPPGPCGSHVEAIRLFGGRTTGVRQYPWLAVLKYAKLDGSSFFSRGGVLIHKNYVLTSSSCVNGEFVVQGQYRLISVRLGEWHKSTNVDCDDDEICAPPPQDIPIAEVITHESNVPDSWSQHNDIALLRLERSATITDYVRPICLPFDSLGINKTLDRRPLIYAGWGRTETESWSNVKLKADVIGLSLEQCNRRWSGQNLSIGEEQVCTGKDKTVYACAQAGEPLMAQDTSDTSPIIYLIGVSIYGPKNCGSGDRPEVYTRVSAYIDWILSHMRN